jgi:hypothetical protein
MIQYMDNFQFYGTGAGARDYMLAGLPWAQLYMSSGSLVQVVDDPDPNAPSDSRVLLFRMNGTGSDGVKLACPSTSQQMGFATRLWHSSLPESAAHGAGLCFNNASNETLYMATVTPTGAISIWRRDGDWSDVGSGDDVLLETTSGPVVSAGAWWHWEFFVDTATGDYQLRIEGIEVISGNDASHHTDPIGMCEYIECRDSTASTSVLNYAKDMIVWDDTGSFNNTFIGPVSVYMLQLDGDISDTNVTPSTGSVNYTTADEATPSDSDYMTLGATPAEVVMSFENVPADVVAIRAIQTIVRAQKTDGGDAQMQVGVVSNGDEDTGSNDAVLTTYSYHFDVSEADPDTGAAWTPAAVNAAYIRINRTL